ncbi:hypothetical protein QCA50_018407 [Cerrena zonata]|uniref:Mediator of RNA polymerase II transcription subunit 25 von Willebrand factor type A domain-containing protein n=1 Tax=Cerrena zonata TaxID=2478898 RepID=A0AAW0FPB1_9APHY
MALALKEVVGVACVVDSSLTLASEWNTVLKDYIAPLLHRVMENHHPLQLRTAFVCYGPAGNRPQPVLETQYFMDPKLLIQHLKDDPSKYGIGQTGNGGDNGLAALEALVATIELFDILKESMQYAVSYVIHIAAFPPDSAERPLYNSSSRLDTLTWDNLPSELRKRDIHYTNILLRRIPKLTQFFTAAANGPTQPAWFNVRAPHQLHICGLPARKANTKRANETPADRSPEAKRVRTQPNQPSPKSSPVKAETPKVAPAIPPPQPVAGPSSTPSQPPSVASGSTTTVPTPASAVPTPAGAPAGISGSNISQMSIMQLLAFADKLGAFENQIKVKFEDLKAQVSSGKQVEPRQVAELQNQGQLAHRMREEIATHLKENPQKAEQVKQFQMKRLATQQQRLMQSGQQPTQTRAQQQAQNQNQAQQTSQAAQGASTSTSTNTSTNTNTNTSLAATQAAVASGPSAPQPSTTNETASHPASQMSQLTPAMAAQFQKLEQQRNRTPHMPPAAIPSTSPSKPDIPMDSSAHRSPSIWAGTLTWKDPSPAVNTTYTASAVVLPNPKSGPEVSANGWPPSIHLTFDDEPAPPAYAVATWKENYKNSPVFMLPISSDPQREEKWYRLLSKYLSENKKTARATWTNPDGISSSLLFIFPFKDGQSILASLYFPQGANDLPKGTVAGFNLHTIPTRLGVMLMKLPKETQEVLSRLPPDQRQPQLINFLKAAAGTGPAAPQLQAAIQAQFQAHRLMAQQHAQAQAQAQAQGQVTPQMRQMLPPGTAAALNAMNMNPQQLAQGAVTNPMQGQPVNMGAHMQNPGVMHQRTPSGGGVAGGNISPEMMQSFMQRNTGATGGM